MRQVKTKTNTNTSTNSKNNLLQFMWFVHFAQIRVSELKILSLFLIKQRWFFFFFWGKTLSSHVPVILHPYLHYSVACFLVTVHIQKHHSGLFAFLGLKRTNQKMDNYILLAWQLLLVLISFIMCVSVCVCIY